ncbi:hypothetical protein N7539_002091 [Penicillium diatomitis]|uniref:Uncharacterized protein n=1 Tax=Penicillium diatomitis TaxID=2819901 RepID=A0A9X0C0P5_9EURO|nr:uncharacterized protein N7539_002091 [Penicillium diatomitis]KAJ5493345.1 hypothetical protein N7539_002091 [Penicillium diatomitis]
MRLLNTGGVSCLALLNLATLSRASPWFGTQYVELVATTDAYYGWPVTTAIPVKPTVTNPVVLSTMTVSDFEDDVTAVDLVVAPSAATPIHESNTYYMVLTFTPPTTCSFTHAPTPTTKTCYVDIPTEAQGFASPTAIVTSTATGGYFSVTKSLVDPSSVPTGVYDYYSLDCYPYSWRGCDSNTGIYTGSSGTSGTDSTYEHCYDFTETLFVSTNAIGGGRCCNGDCKYTWGVSFLQLILIVVFSWTGFWLIMSLWESWVIFRRAMVGRKSRRGVPTCFIFIWSLLFCIMARWRRRVPEKTPEQQEWLTERWNAMSLGAKIGLWLKNMFKVTDPSAALLNEAVMRYTPPSQDAPLSYPPPSEAPPGGPGAPGATDPTLPPHPASSSSPSISTDVNPGEDHAEKGAHLTVAPVKDHDSDSDRTLEPKDESRVTAVPVREI